MALGSVQRPPGRGNCVNLGRVLAPRGSPRFVSTTDCRIVGWWGNKGSPLAATPGRRRPRDSPAKRRRLTLSTSRPMSVQIPQISHAPTGSRTRRVQLHRPAPAKLCRRCRATARADNQTRRFAGAVRQKVVIAEGDIRREPPGNLEAAAVFQGQHAVRRGYTTHIAGDPRHARVARRPFCQFAWPAGWRHAWCAT